ncbi:MAG: SDR family NAD(P)-dependent oxidoreductase [Bosea sp. (in: a-proteobacteria)]
MSDVCPMRAVTLVTGASSGIGRELARLAAREGEVLLVARGRVGLSAVADEINAAGGTARWFACDGTEIDAAAQVLAHLEASGSFCHQLVNNAGFGITGMAGETDPAEQMSSIDLNVRFLAALALGALPGMLARKRGGILNVGSVAGFLPGPGMAVYYATKAFVQSLSDSLWQETQGTGVRVTSLAPGPVNTDFLKRATAGRRVAEMTRLHVDVAEVARQGWSGFKAGKRLVVPGLPNRLALLVAHLMPRDVMAGMVMRRQQGRVGKQ